MMYQFEHPEYLHALWLIPLLVIGNWMYRNWQLRAQQLWGESGLFQKMAAGRSESKRWYKLFYICLAILMLGIALANPQVGTKMQTVKRQGVDLVFALDVSKSMLAEDIAPSRLEKAKYLISQSLEELGGDRVGIIAYAGKAYPLLPITTDYTAAKLALSTHTHTHTHTSTNMVTSASRHRSVCMKSLHCLVSSITSGPTQRCKGATMRPRR